MVISQQRVIDMLRGLDIYTTTLTLPKVAPHAATLLRYSQSNKQRSRTTNCGGSYAEVQDRAVTRNCSARWD